MFKPRLGLRWWRHGDLNPTPLACHASALPNELCPRRWHIVTQCPNIVQLIYEKKRNGILHHFNGTYR